MFKTGRIRYSLLAGFLLTCIAVPTTAGLFLRGVQGPPQTATVVSVTFGSNPVSIADSTGSSTTVTPVTVNMSDGSTYAGTPTGACATQSPCPFGIAGSAGAWTVRTATTLNSSYDISNASYTVTANAVSGTLTYSITGSGTVACDYGPNATFPTGTVGTDLTTAGFTHCALNADFSDQSGAVTGGGFKMTDTSTFINACKGGNNWGLFWVSFYTGVVINGDTGGQTPCNRAVLTTDGAAHVLALSYSASDVTGSSTGIGLGWPLCGNNCLNFRPALPNAHLVEYTFRVSTVSQPQTNLYILGEESLFDNSPQQGGYLDTAILEANSNNGDNHTSLDTYSPGCPSNKCSNGMKWNSNDFGNYHTFAYLTTTDGSSNMATCVYLDGAAIPSNSGVNWPANRNCAAWSFGSVSVSALITDHDNRTYLQLADLNSPASNFNSATLFIKSVRVWTCSNYKGSGNNCTGTVVNHP